jgi:hypothetical protein
MKRLKQNCMRKKSLLTYVHYLAKLFYKLRHHLPTYLLLFFRLVYFSTFWHSTTCELRFDKKRSTKKAHTRYANQGDQTSL